MSVSKMANLPSDQLTTSQTLFKNTIFQWMSILWFIYHLVNL